METFRTISASELFATEIGITGTPLPSNGLGRTNPKIKYVIVGAVIVTAIIVAIHLNKKTKPVINLKKNERRTK
jgi:hypothetical protein